MLGTRLVLGTLMIVALAGIVCADGYVSVHYPQWAGLLITLLIAVLVIFAGYELGRLMQAGDSPGGYKPVTHWAAFVSAGLVVIPWIEMRQSTTGLSAIWLTGGLLVTCLAVLGRKTTVQAIGNMASTLFIILYLGLLASFVVRVRLIWPGAAGAAILVFTILTVKSSDIGAYFVGSALGRHKLAPWVSPGKTVEGAVGALATSAAVAIGAMVLWGHYQAVVGPAPLKMAQAAIFGLLMAIFGHLGDLVESAIKRDIGQKDSARVVPAFGGLLDIIDSPLFTAPVAWWVLTNWVRH